jgi:hypothetical protein
VVVGTPGRVVRLRFKESLVERLLKVQWWRYSVYDLFDAPMDNVEAALDVIEDLEARGAITPYAGRMVTPTDLTDAAALAAELAPAPMARAS